ncbi:MAG TPA: Maf family protein [Nitrospira sp.]|nr:Maf family protein [Nitrospira sp.]
MRRLVLASTSPRRRDLLALLGIPFEIRDPIYEEVLVPDRSADELVRSFAQRKADSVAQHDPEALVLASDTLIELDGKVLGKPGDLIEARRILRHLAGREHRVKTAVTMACRYRHLETTDISNACIRMKPFDAEAHERYLATGDSLGKAGAYSIQGPGVDLIESLEGDFTTVVGFPLRLVVRMLQEGGMTVPVDVDLLYDRKPYSNWARFAG